MRVKILGTRGYIPEARSKHRKYSGVLINQNLLFDIGEADFLLYEPRAIWITHLHPDHAFFVSTRSFHRFKCPVYAPERYDMIPEIKELNRSIQSHHAKITPIPTIHALRVKSQGYLVETKRKRIFYSGDLITIEKEYRAKFGKLDLVITDGSAFRRGGLIRRFGSKVVGHNGIGELVRLFQSYTKRIIFMHFGSWFMKDVTNARVLVRELSTDELTVEAAYDGKEYEI